MWWWVTRIQRGEERQINRSVNVFPDWTTPTGAPTYGVFMLFKGPEPLKSSEPGVAPPPSIFETGNQSDDRNFLYFVG